MLMDAAFYNELAAIFFTLGLILVVLIWRK